MATVDWGLNALEHLANSWPASGACGSLSYIILPCVAPSTFTLKVTLWSA